MNDYLAGATSVVELLFLQDSTSTAGAGKTGLLFNTAGLTCYYKRSNGTASVAVTLVTITTLGTYASGGFKAVDATNMPGCYEFHPPDAAFAAGAKEVTFFFAGATGLAQRPIKFRLQAVNPDDAVRGGMTALPNAVAGANTGLPVVGTQVPNATAGASGGLFIAGTNAATTVTTSFTTTFTGNLTGSVGSVTGAVGSVTGLTASDVGAIKTKTDFLPSATAGAAGGVFIAGTNAATTVTTSFTTTFTGNLTGSVGSVTGSVGSISGVTFPTNFGVLAIAATTGQVGLDWANIKSPTTTVALTGTTIATTQKVDLETIKTQAVTAAAGVTFPTSVASPTNITAGTITTTTNLTNAPTAGDFTAAMKTSLNAATPASVTGSVGSVTARVTANADQVAGSATAATNLGAQLLAQASGNVNDAAATTTSFVGNAGLSATNDAYTNQVIAFTSGTLAGVARKVADYVGATKTFTLTPALPSAPANSVTFVILGYAP